MQRKILPDGKFRDRLESAREKCGLSPAELARVSGLTPTAVSRYRSGERSPNAEELLRLANGMEVTMEWLLTGDDPEESELVLRDQEVPYRVKTKKQQEGEAIALELEALAERVRLFISC